MRGTETNDYVPLSPRDVMSESAAISSTGTTQMSTVDLLGAFKDAKTGDHTTQSVTSTKKTPVTKTDDNNDIDDKPESVNSSLLTEDSKKMAEPEEKPSLRNVSTPPMNQDIEDSSTTALIDARVFILSLPN